MVYKFCLHKLKTPVIISLIILLPSLLFLNGCASIISGSTQPLTFQSVPNGATVLINGQAVGTTPISLNVRKSRTTNVLVRKDGYKDQLVNPSTKVNGLFWGNIITGGVFGSTTDSATGAMYEYAPDQYFVTLQAGDTIPEQEKSKNETESEIKKYILTNYDPITRELIRGKGPYLEGLLGMLQVHKTRTSWALVEVKKIFTNTNDAATFCDAVITEFETKPKWKKRF